MAVREETCCELCLYVINCKQIKKAQELSRRINSGEIGAHLLRIDKELNEKAWLIQNELVERFGIHNPNEFKAWFKWWEDWMGGLDNNQVKSLLKEINPITGEISKEGSKRFYPEGSWKDLLGSR